MNKISQQTADDLIADIDNMRTAPDYETKRTQFEHIRNHLNSLVSKDEVDKCPICEGRKIMNQMYSMVDKIPLIGSSIFDDGTANIINELDDAKSTWCCMCLDKESEG